MIWARRLKLLTKFGAAALALGALATSGKAQAYQGKFTLPFETHWAGATLPAGDYTFVMSSLSSDYRLYIRGAQVNAIIRATSTDDIGVSAHAQLNLVDIADVQTVQTFDAPELGRTFIYSAPSQKHMGRKEAHQKMAPQTAPASQVSELEHPSLSTVRVAKERSHASHCKCHIQKSSGCTTGKALPREAA